MGRGRRGRVRMGKGRIGEEVVGRGRGRGKLRKIGWGRRGQVEERGCPLNPPKA